jgi:XTP/dITP diphosphohydrolase
MRIIIASRNKRKVREIRQILSGLPIEFLTLDDLNELPEIVEDGFSYKENAIKKAQITAKFTHMWALADDSGIEVSALGNRPGIFSSRYAGPNAKDKENNIKLLGELKDVPLSKRAARYKAVVVLASPDSKTFVVEGSCKGFITEAPKGRSGFGYDPIFFVPRYAKTMAELGMKIKNKISHRAKAIRKIKPILGKIIKNHQTKTYLDTYI